MIPARRAARHRARWTRRTCTVYTAHRAARATSGVVLGGVSAGAICWFEQGITDSIAGPLTAMGCMGLLPGSCCPHYDGEAQRRPTFRRLVARGEVLPGVAADDGAALHYIGDKLAHAVSSRRGASAWRVSRSRRKAVERRIRTAQVRR
ncbi:MAG: Type 1 glutamine amidotransferase-like domain-containing protein [Betaproteobacteria bacterium]